MVWCEILGLERTNINQTRASGLSVSELHPLISCNKTLTWPGLELELELELIIIIPPEEMCRLALNILVCL